MNETTPFPEKAHAELRDSQLRANIRRATSTIRAKTNEVIGELPDWQALREAGRAAKAGVMAALDERLVELETRVVAAGGQVHWARDAAEARGLIVRLAGEAGGGTVIKIKSNTTDEIALNPALQAAGMDPVETDLADMIVQLAHDTPSHILVPAIHKNRSEIRELFMESFHLDRLTDDPPDLTAAARTHLRQKFLSARVAVSGANFAIAETGTVCVVESEGNGRMCLTLPETLITVMGIDKVLSRWDELGVFLQLLPRASTGERMNPYTSFWTGVVPGDGPQAFHLVLLDNGRSRILADPEARETLHCIRCSRCLNVCPVYEHTGGHAYSSMYQGPIGAILTPQLKGLQEAGSLPYASTLCGACYEACPVMINIPRILVHLRAEIVEQDKAGVLGRLAPENLAMQAALWAFKGEDRLGLAQTAGRVAQGVVARDGMIPSLPGPLGGWTHTRDFPALPKQSFREWWQARERGKAG